MDIYLVRHALAEPRDATRWPDDSLRPLSSDGIELFRRAARGLLRLGIGVDVVLSSSYRRASQTAEILSEDAEWPRAEMCQALEPPAGVLASITMLEMRSESSLAVVGHQPELAAMASFLLTASEDAVRLEFKKGGVMCLRFTGGPRSGAGALRWSVSPKILRQLGR